MGAYPRLFLSAYCSATGKGLGRMGKGRLQWYSEPHDEHRVSGQAFYRTAHSYGTGNPRLPAPAMLRLRAPDPRRADGHKAARREIQTCGYCRESGHIRQDCPTWGTEQNYYEPAMAGRYQRDEPARETPPQPMTVDPPAVNDAMGSSFRFTAVLERNTHLNASVTAGPSPDTRADTTSGNAATSPFANGNERPEGQQDPLMGNNPFGAGGRTDMGIENPFLRPAERGRPSPFGEPSTTRNSPFQTQNQDNDTTGRDETGQNVASMPQPTAFEGPSTPHAAGVPSPTSSAADSGASAGLAGQVHVSDAPVEAPSPEPAWTTFQPGMVYVGEGRMVSREDFEAMEFARRVQESARLFAEKRELEKKRKGQAGTKKAAGGGCATRRAAKRA